MSSFYPRDSSTIFRFFSSSTPLFHSKRQHPMTLQRLLLSGLIVAAATVGSLDLRSSLSPQVFAADWIGSVSTDYFTPLNWSGTALPASGEAVNVGAVSFTNAPVYAGDNTATPAGIVKVGLASGGAFTVNSGTFGASNMWLGGVSTALGSQYPSLTVNGGAIAVNAPFDANAPFTTSYVSGAKSIFTMTAGEVNVSALFLNGNEVLFAANGALGGNAPGTLATVVMSGGTFTSPGRIRFGRSNSNDPLRDNARAEVTLSGGLMWAKGVDGAGTLNFQGGQVDFTGGVLRGGDMSSNDGFRKLTANAKRGGVDFSGGVLEIITNVSEGGIYIVPAGVDPTTVNITPFQRGQSRTLGVSGTSDEDRFFTTLTNAAVRCLMTTDPVSGKQQSNGFASNKGDYNLDGMVNMADYTVWTAQNGNTYSTDPLDATAVLGYYGGDGNGDGVVNSLDYDVWNSLYGQSTVGGPYVAAQNIAINVGSGTQTQSAAGYPQLTFLSARDVTKSGAGTVVFDATNTYTGTTFVQQGTLQLATQTAANSSRFVPQAGGVLALPSAVSLETTVEGLNPNAGGLTDVASGRMTVSRGLNPASLVIGLVVGRSGGSFSGTSGITSSTAAAELALGTPRSVGWLDNGDGSVTFAYAAPGDTNIDWTIDVLDAANFLALGKFDSGSPASWLDGDFNYDGIVDILDASDFFTTGLFNEGNYNLAPAPGGSITAVPEPAVLPLACLLGSFAVIIRLRRCGLRGASL